MNLTRLEYGYSVFVSFWDNNYVGSSVNQGSSVNFRMCIDSAEVPKSTSNSFYNRKLRYIDQSLLIKFAEKKSQKEIEHVW